MSLLNLPPELLRYVIEESVPEGFESLLLSCRHIYECGKHLIASHNTRKGYWEHLEVDRYFNYMSTFSLLHRVADEPLLLRYIESVDFLRRQDHTRSFGNFELQKWDDATLDRIKRFIEESPYLRKAEKVAPEKWAQSMLFENVDRFDRYLALITPFFLTLLPNVKVLVLPGSLSCFIAPPSTGTQDLDFHHEVWDVMEVIRQSAEKSPEHAPLGKLANLQIYGYHRDDTGSIFDLRALSPFLVLPNLTKLRLANCVATRDYPSGVGYRWHYSDMNSGLREIHLDCGCMDSDGLSQLLSHTPHLKYFRYSHANKSGNLPRDWDAGAFIATIGKHVGSQLEALSVIWEIRKGGRLITGVTSMKEFTKLKFLTLDTYLFCGPPIASGGGSGSSCAPPREGSMPWTIGSIPPLIPMLPSSLDALHLVLDFGNNFRCPPEVIRRLFVNSVVDRPRLLPNLEDFRLIGYLGSGNIQTIRDIVEPAGVLCNFD
ncbi:hypothetical protein F5Y06DRAFT_282748 [Hypoxylon sp. FL0890]|nr:hypothetical protein F5Y06DRAFT_282748 [Hypoxylon sp. FL0890]